MRASYNRLNQIHSNFNSKVITKETAKITKKFNGLWPFKYQRYGYQTVLHF